MLSTSSLLTNKIGLRWVPLPVSSLENFPDAVCDMKLCPQNGHKEMKGEQKTGWQTGCFPPNT